MPFWTRLDQTYTVTPNAGPHEYIFIDIDSDGDLDLVQALFHFPLQNSGLPLRVLLNDGAGQFTDGTSALFPGGAPLTVHPRGYVVDDFNGDGRDDLFIVDHGYDVSPFPGAQNTLVLSSGAHGVLDATATNIPSVTDFTHSVAAGDLDGDGDIDFIVMNVYGGPAGASGNPYVLLNDGAGDFTREDALLPSWVTARDTQRFTSTMLFDADNDGELDLFLGAHGLSSINHSYLLLNPGGGDFSAASAIEMPAGALTNGNVTQIVAVTSGDLNGDGLEDIVAVRNPDDQTRSYQILINQGGGVFVDETAALLGPISSPTGSWTHSVQLADLNGDGHLDMIARNGPLSPVFMNDGSGRLIQLPSSFFDYGGWGTPDGLAHIPADVNGDGRLDIIATAENGFMFVFVQQDQGLSISGTPGADGLLGDASSETLSGGDGADVIFAAQGDDHLNGEGGNDVLIGGDGQDYLDGGAGADELNGGDGDDIIVYDADDDATHVHGGAGFDLLVFSGGAAPSSFDLIGQGFEGAEARFIDVGNVEAWATQTLRYDQLWRLDREAIGYDDNSRVVLDYDEQSVETWSLKWTRFDTLGRVDLEVLTFDDGARANLDYDQASASPWTTMWSLYDASDNLLAEAIDYDDGARITLAHDTVDAFDWSENWVSYDALDRVDAEAIDYDDGTRITQNYDQDNSQAWTTDWVRYDALDRVDVQVITYDDGTYAVQDFDQADEYSWQSQWWLYDSNDNLIAFQGVNDDGSPFG